MKILGISGSPRPKHNTARLVQRVLAKCESLGAQTDYASVADIEIKPCRGCEACMRHGECVIDDGYAELLPRLVDADGLVIGSPNYAFTMSAQMKALFDRSHCLLYYRRELKGKYGVGLCASGDPYKAKFIAKQMAQGVWLAGGYMVGHHWGESVNRDEPVFEDEERIMARADRLGEKLCHAVQTQRKYRVQDFLRRRLVDRALRKMVATKAEKYPHIYGHYRERGWV